MLRDVDAVMRDVCLWITGREGTYTVPSSQNREDVAVPVKNTSNNIQDHVPNWEELRDYVLTHTELPWNF
jgi:hypothetical protein